MPWCPECKYEYNDDCKICPDCGAQLVDELPKKSAKPDNAYNNSMNPVLLAAGLDNVKLGIIRSLLEENGICCLSKVEGADGYMKIIFGSPLCGTDIYVDESDYADAVLLAESVLSSDGDDEQLSDDESEPEPDEPQSSGWAKYQKVMLFVIILAIAIPIFVILWSRAATYFGGFLPERPTQHTETYILQTGSLQQSDLI